MMNNTFKLVVEPHAVSWTDKYTGRVHSVHRSDRLVDASWEFEDGVKIHIRETAIDTAHYGGYGGRVDRTHTQPYKKARMYVSSDAPFDVLEDLTNRTRRPHTLLKAPALEAIARIGLHPTKASWNQRAGCSCGCSPAFVLEGVPEARRFDIWVTLPGVPTIDESKPGRQLVGTL